MALITLADAKTHLSITTEATDAELQSFVDVACALVQGYADRAWDVGTVTETFDGGGTVFLLRQTPITALTSVTVSGTLLAATGYQADLSKGIITCYAETLEGTGNVSIVYAVGGTAPALAQHAAKETVRHLWQTQRGNAVRNAVSGDEYIPGLGFSLPHRVMELLDPIRNVG